MEILKCLISKFCLASLVNNTLELKTLQFYILHSVDICPFVSSKFDKLAFVIVGLPLHRAVGNVFLSTITSVLSNHYTSVWDCGTMPDQSKLEKLLYVVNHNLIFNYITPLVTSILIQWLTLVILSYDNSHHGILHLLQENWNSVCGILNKDYWVEAMDVRK